MLVVTERLSFVVGFLEEILVRGPFGSSTGQPSVAKDNESRKRSSASPTFGVAATQQG